MYGSPATACPVLLHDETLKRLWLHDETLKRLWLHDRPLRSLSAEEVRGLTAAGCRRSPRRCPATDGSRLMLDLPGGPGERAVRRIVDVVRECGAQDRVYYTAGATAMLAVRAADPPPPRSP